MRGYWLFTLLITVILFASQVVTGSLCNASVTFTKECTYIVSSFV